MLLYPGILFSYYKSTKNNMLFSPFIYYPANFSNKMQIDVIFIKPIANTSLNLHPKQIRKDQE